MALLLLELAAPGSWLVPQCLARDSPKLWSVRCDRKSCAQLGHVLPALSLCLRLELGWGVGEPASPSRKVSHGGNGRPYEGAAYLWASCHGNWILSEPLYVQVITPTNTAQ